MFKDAPICLFVIGSTAPGGSHGCRPSGLVGHGLGQRAWAPQDLQQRPSPH